MAFFRALFQQEESGSAEARLELTPGRLYEIMVREFEASRPKCPSRCPMPLPMPAPRDGADDCNWRLQRLVPPCDSCEDALARLFVKYRAVYNLREVSA